MTTAELHIALDVETQKINSNSTRNIEPREKDFLLNRQVTIFLNKVTRDISNNKRKGFEEDSKRLKDIQPLIRNKTLVVEQINEEKGRVILPSFVYKPIRFDNTYIKKCKENEGLEKNISKKLYTFKLPSTNRAKVTIKRGNNNKVLFNSNTLPINYIKNYNFNLINAFISIVREELKHPFYNGLELYYENFGDIYKQNTFFIVASNSFTGVIVQDPAQLSANINDLSSNYLVEVSNYPYRYINTSPPVSFSTSDDLSTAPNKVKTITKQGRTVNEEELRNLLESSISGSIQESPLNSLKQNILEVYHPKNCVISLVNMAYICTPNKIDILLNIDLNLDRDICLEIVSDTAQFIKALFDSNNYEKFINENIIKE